VSKNTALTYLQCYNNQLTSLDVSKNTALTRLYCQNNKLNSLDVSKNTLLTVLWCYNNQLTSLDVSKNTALTDLYCYSNQLTTLDVSKNTALTTLLCNNNQLTSLDVSKNTALIGLSCFSNQLTSLDVSKNTALTMLRCYNNQLTSLDVSGCTALTELRCFENQLTTLDVSNNTALTVLRCYNNQIHGVGMTTLVNSLPTVTGGNFFVYNTDGTDGNRITTVQVAAAKAKGWSVKTSSGGDYAGVAPGIAIDATNFPDEKFREYVSSKCDTDKDTYLSEDEIAAVTSINVNNKNISDLKGIEYFTALKELYCGSNQLTSLDVSKNTALTSLICDYNQLTSLDASGCTALTTLYCENNQLTSLDVSKNTALTLLYCHINQLTSLNVSKNTALTYLACFLNQIQGSGMATLVNNLPIVASGNGNFEVYDTDGTDGNRITTVQVAAAKAKGWDVKTADGGDYAGVDPGIAINATNFPDEKFREYVSTYCDKDKDTYLSDEEISAVKGIYALEMSITNLKGIEYFTALTYLACYSNKLTSLDVSKNTALKGLECDDNLLTTLDVSKNTALTYLTCDYNQLTTLDVSKNTALTVLACNGNKLTSLDVSKNTALIHLQCYDTQLASLDVSKNTALTELWCGRNQLTSLDVSKNTALTELRCYNDQIQGAGMATLVNGLPTVTSGKFYVYNIKGTEGNQITTVQVAAAKAKGWDVKTADGDDYPGINIPADANGDGEVNATDVATVRDYILGLDPKPFSLESANLNGDSTVNIADLAKLIQLLTE
ncbi:MAG: leucine-rich repeat domain-containing protein, partial [Prevotella sp.]|nr:leucine-rich repeat domain-containing protein [Prevotella sp.]